MVNTKLESSHEIKNKIIHNVEVTQKKNDIFIQSAYIDQLPYFNYESLKSRFYGATKTFCIIIQNIQNHLFRITFDKTKMSLLFEYTIKYTVLDKLLTEGLTLIE